MSLKTLILYLFQLLSFYTFYIIMLMMFNSLGTQEKPRKKVKLDLINSDEYDQFKGEIIDQIPYQSISVCQDPSIQINFNEEMKFYDKIYRDIQKNPKAHKKLMPKKIELKQKKQQLKVIDQKCKKDKITKQTNNVKQQRNKNVLKKISQTSSNWKQFLNKQENMKKPNFDFVAIDCEFVKAGQIQCLARISLVNENGEQLYDSYVKPTKKITDFVTNISGITYSHIKNAPTQQLILPEIKKKMLNKIIIGHTTQKDLQVCGLKDWKGFKKIIDIAECEQYSPGGKRLSLKKLAYINLGKNIQESWHSSLEDAKITMELFLKNKKQILKENKLIK